MNNQFEQLQEYLAEEQENDNRYNNVEVELAYQVNPQEKMVTPGINIFATEFDAPLFLSIGELRDAADKAESLVSQLMNNNL